jgi:hypothetical protein
LRGLGDVEILLVRPRDPAAAPSAADYRALWNAAADESIAIVLEIWERYRKAGASWKTPGSPAPGVVEQTDPLIGSIAKADADDNDRDRLRGRFNSAVEYVFGKWGGDFMRKVQAWAATIGGEDAYWGKGAQDAAAAEIAAYTAAGWPLWPFWSDHRASSRSPYQIGKGYKDSNAAFEGMPAASQQAITKLWAMFVAHLDDPTIAYLARFGVSPWDNTPGSPAIVGDLDYPIATAVFGGSFDSLTPDHWWNVSGFAPVIAATIAAVHFGAPIDETRRATTRRFLTEVVEQDWTDHPTAGYAVPRAVEMRSGASFTAWPMAEAARIAIEEAQASAPTLLLVRSRGATPAAPRTPEQRRELADKLPSSLHSQAIGPTIESPTAQKVATVATVTVAGALIYAAKTIIPHLLRRWI